MPENSFKWKHFAGEIMVPLQKYHDIEAKI